MVCNKSEDVRVGVKGIEAALLGDAAADALIANGGRYISMRIMPSISELDVAPRRQPALISPTSAQRNVPNHNHQRKIHARCSMLQHSGGDGRPQLYKEPVSSPAIYADSRLCLVTRSSSTRPFELRVRMELDDAPVALTIADCG